MVLKPFFQDEKIHLYTSSLSVLTWALGTLICVLFPAAVMMGLSSGGFIMLSCFLSDRPHSTKDISHVGINSKVADI